MTNYKCSGLILYDQNNKILLEDRRKIKKHGEHWSFFGGSLKEGETKEQALIREIKEELNYDLKEYKFLGEYTYTPKKDLTITYYMYATKLPDIESLAPHEKAGMKLFTIKQALRLKTLPIDKKIIAEYDEINPGTKNHRNTSSNPL